ncbi:hypothetical protein BE20_12195 [Sorangium cellulosum]|nr:hypothetical protein BE20_12195 [Sorangium cellulosum]
MPGISWICCSRVCPALNWPAIGPPSFVMPGASVAARLFSGMVAAEAKFGSTGDALPELLPLPLGAGCWPPVCWPPVWPGNGNGHGKPPGCVEAVGAGCVGAGCVGAGCVGAGCWYPGGGC